MIAPNGGESWARGSENTISWSFTGDPAGRTVKIELIRGSGFRSTLKSARAIGKGGHGSYSWTVSSVKPSTRYRVCITINDTASTDWSDAPFAIT